MFWSRNLNSYFAAKAATFLVAVFLFSASAFATDGQNQRPVWFPKVACRVQWGGKDLAAYDYSKDARPVAGQGNLGYANYQNRIKIEQRIDRKDCYKDWTVLVYMAADNDLSPYALWDLHEMEGPFKSGKFAGSTLKSDLLVQADTKGLDGIRRLHIFQAPGENYTAPRGVDEFVNASPAEIRSPIVELAAERSATTASEHKTKLRDFLNWGIRNYPAEHYFVIVWGHGQGWAPDSSQIGGANAGIFSARFGGFPFSDAPGDYLSIPSLNAIYADIVKNTLGGRPIDVYAADACLMQMTEVAYEVSHSARFIVGSAQVQTYLGLPYRQMMYELNTSRFAGAAAHVGRSDEAYVVAKMIPTIMERSLDPIHGQQGRADKEASRDFTMSAIDSSELISQLTPALSRMGNAISNYISEDPLRALDIQFTVKSAPSFMGGARELGSFTGLLELQVQNDITTKKITTPQAQALLHAVTQVREAIDRTVLNWTYGANYRTANAALHLVGFRALGIWLPPTTQDYSARVQDFNKSAFYKDTQDSWSGWMSSVYAGHH